MGPEGLSGIQSESSVALFIKEEQVGSARAIHLYVLEVPQGGVTFQNMHRTEQNSSALRWLQLILGRAQWLHPCIQ